ncbi:MAG: efflux RND transporter periplasmic adaptor subunit [Sedimentisphaerales bacterium]|nr:efflux RND transporter periplasmic adaptor subunit [Sedimentisphaerales bacterium]
MKRSRVIAAAVVFVVLAAAGVGFVERGSLIAWYDRFAQEDGAKGLYYCPMHPSFTSDRPGNCAICGMSLVKRETADPPGGRHRAAGSDKTVLYYRNPMNPQVTSPVPMKDEMGMDYVPVYEDREARSHPGVHISTEKQQLIGVKKGKVQVRNLCGQVVTVGTVAYDPTLFTAQQEYLQVLKGRRAAGGANGGYVDDQASSLLKAARSKLLLLGMSEGEIGTLEKRGTPQTNLYLPTSEDENVWVYVTVYEYEAAMVKEGMTVEADAPAYPGRTFQGRIVSIAPVLQAATRTFKARALVNNPDGLLKLEMFVNVRIGYDLGDRLAVPEDAVMHAGARDIVFVADAEGYFTPRTVRLGVKAQGYYEVLQGLTADEDVVTSGNFLVDSESKLNAVLNRMGEPNQPGGGHHD